MRIKHWDYNTGWRTLYNIKGNYDKEFDEYLVGWHCWAYPEVDENIIQWMKDNMKGSYECDFRFNSGDPMHTIHIRSAVDATLFKLRWM
jgi:hypothetical protein